MSERLFFIEPRALLIAACATSVLLSGQDARSAQVDTELDCIFNDSALFEPDCHAVAEIHATSSARPQADSMIVLCAKGEPIYRGEVAVQSTRDLSAIRMIDGRLPTLVVPGSVFQSPSNRVVGGTLSLPDRSLTGACEIKITAPGDQRSEEAKRLMPM